MTNMHCQINYNFQGDNYKAFSASNQENKYRNIVIIVIITKYCSVLIDKSLFIFTHNFYIQFFTNDKF